MTNVRVKRDIKENELLDNDNDAVVLKAGLIGQVFTELTPGLYAVDFGTLGNWAVNADDLQFPFEVVEKPVNTIQEPGKPAREVRDLRLWITWAGKHSVKTMVAYHDQTDGSAYIITTFSDGTVFKHHWASFKVFADYVLYRSRNFRGVSYTVYPGFMKPKGS